MRRAASFALAVVAILGVPVLGAAQEATIGGTITDSTSGVLPGVAVRAVHRRPGPSSRRSPTTAGHFEFPFASGSI